MPFMEIAGLPLHPLLVHAVVIFAPLAGVGAVAYALFARWRWWLRWPVLLLSVFSGVGAFVAKQSGEQLMADRGLDQLPAVQTHADRGGILLYVALALLVVFAVAAFRLGGPSGLSSGKGARAVKGGAVDLVVVLLCIVVGIGVVVMTILTGHTGAEAVWGS
jgi:hypothetical protein